MLRHKSLSDKCWGWLQILYLASCSRVWWAWEGKGWCFAEHARQLSTGFRVYWTQVVVNWSLPLKHLSQLSLQMNKPERPEKSEQGSNVFSSPVVFAFLVPCFRHNVSFRWSCKLESFWKSWSEVRWPVLRLGSYIAQSFHILGFNDGEFQSNWYPQCSKPVQSWDQWIWRIWTLQACQILGQQSRETSRMLRLQAWWIIRASTLCTEYTGLCTLFVASYS